jgi:hypothetical protein
MIGINFRIFDGSNCSISGGCSIIFDKNAPHQYLPSNNTNYIINLSGTFNISYYDGSVVTCSPIYTSNSWSDYQDVWRYDLPFTAYVNSDTVLAIINIANSSLVTSECSLKIKKIENETVSISTDKDSTLVVHGLNYSYNGENQTPAPSSKIKIFKNDSGNTSTHEIAATTPLTLMFLEKN